MRFYEGREPDWYASAIRPLIGCERVLELGCGPSLALRALRDRGARSVLGIDRWPGFVEVGAARGIPVLLHDLTVPAPFLRSASVDGVLSHYALDYVSPIGVRQALREARRILCPGGKLVLLLAAIGRATGEEARTVRYTPEAVRRILADAGFEQMEVDAPGERNTVAEAVAGESVAAAGAMAIEVTDETQISVGFARSVPGVEIDVRGLGWRSKLELELNGHRSAGSEGVNPAAASARLVRVAGGGWELQACAWHAGRLGKALAVRLSGAPERLTLGCDAPVEHVATWSPGLLGLGPPGDAFVPAGQPAPVGRPSIAVMSSLVSPPGPESLAALDLRAGHGPSVSSLEEAWRSGTINAILLAADQVLRATPALFWAGARSAPVLVQGSTWEHGLTAALLVPLSSPPPMLVLDPALEHRPDSPSAFARAAERALSAQAVHLVATPATISEAALPQATLASLLVSSPGSEPEHVEHPNTALIAAENLRYLCERAWLLQLRTTSDRGPAELGRLSPLG